VGVGTVEWGGESRWRGGKVKKEKSDKKKGGGHERVGGV